MLAGYRIRNVPISMDTGILTLEQSHEIRQRCIVMQIAAKLEVQRFAKYQKLFGMGQEDRNRSSGESIWTGSQCGQYMGPDLAVNSLRTEL